MKKMTVGILLFDDVELLDFTGPYEVFSTTSFADSDEPAFAVRTISQRGGTVNSRNGLQVIADEDFTGTPYLDILVVPGGRGAEKVEVKNPTLVDWIRSRFEQVQTLASVCTGAFLLAEAGLLSGLEATTHWKRIDILQTQYPDVRLLKDRAYVDSGKIVTSGGVAAGIAMSLHLVERYVGRKAAEETAKDMEYPGNF
jgi:transcriptional regulator GlxA family with amidase domain